MKVFTYSEGEVGTYGGIRYRYSALRGLGQQKAPLLVLRRSAFCCL